MYIAVKQHFIGLFQTVQAEAGEKKKKVPAALNFKMKTLQGKEIALSKYQGKVVLFVNVANIYPVMVL